MNRETRIFIMGLIYASIGVVLLAYDFKDINNGTWENTLLDYLGIFCGFYLSIKGLKIIDKINK